MQLRVRNPLHAIVFSSGTIRHSTSASELLLCWHQAHAHEDPIPGSTALIQLVCLRQTFHVAGPWKRQLVSEQHSPVNRQPREHMLTHLQPRPSSPEPPARPNPPRPLRGVVQYCARRNRRRIPIGRSAWENTRRRVLPSARDSHTDAISCCMDSFLSVHYGSGFRRLFFPRIYTCASAANPTRLACTSPGWPNVSRIDKL